MMPYSDVNAEMGAINSRKIAPRRLFEQLTTETAHIKDNRRALA